jgi:hypothetical protein
VFQASGGSVSVCVCIYSLVVVTIVSVRVVCTIKFVLFFKVSLFSFDCRTREF